MYCVDVERQLLLLVGCGWRIFDKCDHYGRMQWASAMSLSVSRELKGSSKKKLGMMIIEPGTAGSGSQYAKHRAKLSHYIS